MDEFMKLIWKECRERFGSSIEVDIHVDGEGVRITTSNIGVNRFCDLGYANVQKKIDGTQTIFIG